MRKSTVNVSCASDKRCGVLACNTVQTLLDTLQFEYGLLLAGALRAETT